MKKLLLHVHLALDAIQASARQLMEDLSILMLAVLKIAP